MALYVSNQLGNLHIGYDDEKLASYHACVESKAKPGISYLPDSLNQPNSYVP